MLSLIAKTGIQRQMEKAGAYQTGAVSPSGIEYLQEIRDICKGNICRQYGKTWACPPAVGTIEECKARCLRYDTMIVFTGKYSLENSFESIPGKDAPFYRGIRHCSQQLGKNG
jgi:predicted metal-binding protein